MKGKVAIRTLVLILVGLVVLVLAVYTLTYVYGLCDAMNPQSGLCFVLDWEKLRFIRYMTCALAKCGNGCSEPQVQNICLEFGPGNTCEKWCKETCNGNTGKLCGEGNAIYLELNSIVFLEGDGSRDWEPPFIGGWLIPIEGGDAQKYGNWVCGSILSYIPSWLVGEWFGYGKCNMMPECNSGDLSAKYHFGFTPIFREEECNNYPQGGLDQAYASSICVPNSYAEEFCTMSTGYQNRKYLKECRFEPLDQSGAKIRFKIWSDEIGLGCAYVHVKRG